MIIHLRRRKIAWYSASVAGRPPDASPTELKSQSPVGK
jgi:hypothetical protein